MNYSCSFAVTILCLSLVLQASSETCPTNPDSISFTQGMEYPARDGRHSVFCARPNQDLHAEMAVADGESESVSVFLKPLICSGSNILVYARTDKETYDSSAFDEDLPAILQEHGYSVTVKDRSQIDVITNDLLADYDELWLLTTDYENPPLIQSEIEAIVSFRDQGNGLLIMADDPHYQDPANDISQQLGVTFYGNVDHGTYCQPIVPNFEAHPIVARVDTIVAYPSEGKIRVDSAGVELVATYQGDTLIAALDDGKGRVVFDVSFTKLFDGCILTGHMPRYVRNIADWLIRRPYAACSLTVVTDTTCLLPTQMKVILTVSNQDSVAAITLPMHYETDCPGLTLDSVSFSGTRIEDWESTIVVIKPDTLILGLIADMGGGTSPLAPGEGPIAYIYFSIPCAPENVYDSCFIAWDTTTVQPENQGLLFVDNLGSEFIPYFEPGTTFVALYRPGDVNCNCTVSVSDVVALINYLFKEGPEPCPIDAGDVNGDCTIDIVDVVYLINYLFKDGPPPICGCVSNPGFGGNCGECNPDQGGLGKVVGTAQVSLTSSRISEQNQQEVEIDAAFAVEVAGVQLELRYDPNKIQSIIPELTYRTKNLDLFFSANEGKLKMGIVDVSGKHLISAGDGALVRLAIKGTDITSLDFERVILVNENATHFEVTILPRRKPSEVKPSEFALLQNYPNPFNPKTEISYTLPYESKVSLIVYNVKGQKVKVLVDEYQTAGCKSVKWDGKDEKRSPVASGVYFYKLSLGTEVMSKKMLLLK